MLQDLHKMQKKKKRGAGVANTFANGDDRAILAAPLGLDPVTAA